MQGIVTDASDRVANTETNIFVYGALTVLALVIICANVWYWRRRSHLSKRQRDREDREDEVENEIW